MIFPCPLSPLLLPDIVESASQLTLAIQARLSQLKEPYSSVCEGLTEAVPRLPKLH